MAYTGSGTQVDPYVVNTFSDFVTCAGITGAYVLVERSMDANNEPSSTIYVRAAKIYSNNFAHISRLTIYDAIGFRDDGNNSHFIENIIFDSVTISSLSDIDIFYGSVYYGSEEGRNRFVFKNCRFHIDATVNSGRRFQLTHKTRFDNCEIRLNMHYVTPIAAYSGIFSKGGMFDNCIIDVQGLYIGTVTSAGVDAGVVQGVFRHCLVKIGYYVLDPFISYQGTFADESQDYPSDKNILLITVQYPAESEYSGAVIMHMYPQGRTTVTDSTYNEYAQIHTSSNHDVYDLTYSQITSESYLAQIGFVTGQEDPPWLFDNYFYGYPHTFNITDLPINDLTIKLGTVSVRKIYIGDDLIWEIAGVNKIVIPEEENQNG